MTPDDRYREGHGISFDEHLDRLKENKWSEEEFEAGFQMGVATKNFLEYEALLRKELAKGKVRKGGGPSERPVLCFLILHLASGLFARL